MIEIKGRSGASIEREFHYSLQGKAPCEALCNRRTNIKSEEQGEGPGGAFSRKTIGELSARGSKEHPAVAIRESCP